MLTRSSRIGGPRQRVLRIACLGLALACGGLVPWPASAAAPDVACFAATGHCLRAGFLAAWQEHGGLAVNGYPLTDEAPERLADGNVYTVQYFERARFEYHPERPAPDDVLRGQVGRDRHPVEPPAPPHEGATYVPATGHNVAPTFLAYWAAHGGLAQFGYPLGEATTAPLEDGRTYTIQWFERARFEEHPEAPAPDRVQLGQLGRQVAAGSFLAPPGEDPTCGAATLALRAGGGRVGIAAGGTLIIDAILTNRGASACALVTTHLPLALADEAGQPLPVAQEHRAWFGAGGDPAEPHPSAWAFVLRPGQAAGVRFLWRNWCPADPPTVRPTLRLTLPDGASLEAPLLAGETPGGSVPQCNDPSAPSVLTDEPLTPLIIGYSDSPIGTYYTAINRSDYRAAYALRGPELQARQPFAAFVADVADTAHDTVAVSGYEALHLDPPYAPDRLSLTVRLVARQRDGAVRRYRGTIEIARVRVPNPAHPGTEEFVEQIVRMDLAPE